MKGDITEAILGFLRRIIPKDPCHDSIKKEIWGDLSDIYYRYYSDNQKRAFREIMNDISQEINEGKWKNIHQKIYRTKRS
jgi:hypothetical protein